MELKAFDIYPGCIWLACGVLLGNARGRVGVGGGATAGLRIHFVLIYPLRIALR